MSLPQIDAALAACGRRDADNALILLTASYHAHAPLIIGEPGWKSMREYERSLRREKSTESDSVLDQRAEADAFASMLAEARQNAATCSQ